MEKKRKQVRQHMPVVSAFRKLPEKILSSRPLKLHNETLSLKTKKTESCM
jgi:hypothetical protein